MVCLFGHFFQGVNNVLRSRGTYIGAKMHRLAQRGAPLSNLLKKACFMYLVLHAYNVLRSYILYVNFSMWIM